LEGWAVGGAWRTVFEGELLVGVVVDGLRCRIDPGPATRAELIFFGNHRSTVVADMPGHGASSRRYCATVLALFAVRQTEGWTAGSISAGILLGIVVIGFIVWAMDRASKN